MKKVIISFKAYNSETSWIMEDNDDKFLPFIEGDLLKIYDVSGKATRYYHWSDVKEIHILDIKEIKNAHNLP